MALSPEQFRKVEEVFHEATALPEEQRAAFVAGTCGEDFEVREEVLSLLEEAAAGPRSPDPLTLVVGGATGRPSVASGLQAPPVLTGQTVGAYRIDGMIGRGGMGVVYRAEDTRLHRVVAVKALPPSWTQQPQQVARFEREAKVLASLSHAGIATVYGLEEWEGQRLLVMEWVDGPTLAGKLKRGPLGIEEALRVGRQVAAAVEAAHDAGVIHRDLKPGNVMIGRDDAVKVLDFGLARFAPGSSPLWHAADRARGKGPSVDPHATAEGSVIGTPGYMSPEQVRGRPVDRRTDVFAFSCILYECLTGAMAFQGDTGADVLACILERDPDWAKLPAKTPEAVRRLLARCTAKEPGQRLRDLGDARLELDEALAQKAWLTPRHEPALPRSPRQWLVAAALLLATAALAVALTWSRRDAAPAAGPAVGSANVFRFALDFPQARPQRALPRLGLALARDGRRLVFFAQGSEGFVSLWRRELDRLDLQRVPFADDGFAPHFSPDGQWVLYTHNGSLWKRWLQGENAIRLHDVHGSWGTHWSDDGRVTFV